MCIVQLRQDRHSFPNSLNIHHLLTRLPNESRYSRIACKRSLLREFPQRGKTFQVLIHQLHHEIWRLNRPNNQIVIFRCGGEGAIWINIDVSRTKKQSPESPIGVPGSAFISSSIARPSSSETP